jgi:integrase
VRGAAVSRERQEVERLAAGDSWQESGLVFTTSVGTVVEPRNLSRTFEHLVQQSGVRRIRFHDLRHTCASLPLAQGVSPRVVMDVLGHSQLSITMDLYSHVMPSALRDAADAMDRALNADSCAGYYPGLILASRIRGVGCGRPSVERRWPR